MTRPPADLPTGETSIYKTLSGYCRRGIHEMTDQNTKVNGKGWKICRACRAASQKRAADERSSDERDAYMKAWRESNREAKFRYRQDHYKRIRAAIDEYKKDKPCLDCGQVFPPCAMDFDHVRGSKRFNVGLAKNLRQLASEIAKCELVCANCHRVRTFNRARTAKDVTPHGRTYTEDTA